MKWFGPYTSFFKPTGSSRAVWFMQGTSLKFSIPDNCWQGIFEKNSLIVFVLFSFYHIFIPNLPEKPWHNAGNGTMQPHIVVFLIKNGQPLTQCFDISKRFIPKVLGKMFWKLSTYFSPAAYRDGVRSGSVSWHGKRIEWFVHQTAVHCRCGFRFAPSCSAYRLAANVLQSHAPRNLFYVCMHIY